MFKIMYGYDKDTKYYTGEVRVQQDPSNPDNYLLPPFVTDVQPTIETGKIPKFNGDGWDLVDDYYGKTVYDKETKESKVYTQHGELPDNLTDKEPSSGEYYVIFNDSNNDWEIDLDKYKSFKTAEATQAFNEFLAQGYTCPTSGIKMDATLDDINKLKSGYDLAVAAGASTLTVRDYDNVNHDLAVDDVKTMLAELGTNYQTVLQKLWGYKDQIAAASTTDDLDNLEFTFEG